MDERTILEDLGKRPPMRPDCPGDDIVRGNIKGAPYNYNRLSNRPKINGVTLQGDLTAEDLGLSSMDKNIYYVQTEASDTWVITHNLNKYPSVSVIDSAGNEVTGSVTYDSENQITIRFNGAFKGSATLN